MANQFLTLKDITAREGTDDVVGLVENIVNVAPELDRVMGRPIPGISFRARIRTAIAGNAAFRQVNGGVNLSASSIDRKRFNCFPFDVQLRVDEALILEGEAEGDTMGQILTEEATGAMRAKALQLGKQFYQGTLNDPNGCPGLIDFLTTARTQVDSRTGLKINQTVDAGGTTAGACQVVWFIKQGPQGVHWLFGRGRGIVMNPWEPQQTAASNQNTASLASVQFNRSWTSNLFGYIGTAMANYHAVGAIINVNPTVTITNGTLTYANSLTDQQIADLWALFPITEKPDMAFCTQLAAASLQAQRTITNMVGFSGGDRKWTGGIAPIADFPTTLPTAGNIPLVVTDSIQPGNQLVLT